MEKIYKSHLKMNHYKKPDTRNYQIAKKFRGCFVSHIGILGVVFTSLKIIKSLITN